MSRNDLWAALVIVVVALLVHLVTSRMPAARAAALSDCGGKAKVQARSATAGDSAGFRLIAHCR